MRRREFIALAGGVAVAWPFSASPQHSPLPVVGFISIASASGFSHLVAALRRSLSERGYDEGRNYSMEFRWAEGRPERLPAMATELVERGVSLIIATGGSLPANAAKSATTKIPIIFSSGTDPVKAGLVTSFNRPGGNVTGIYIFGSMMDAKRLGLLREIVPKAKTIAGLVNSTYPTVDLQISQVEDGARSLGLQTQIFRTSPGRRSRQYSRK